MESQGLALNCQLGDAGSFCLFFILLSNMNILLIIC